MWNVRIETIECRPVEIFVTIFRKALSDNNNNNKCGGGRGEMCG